MENFDYECMTPELVAERLRKETDTAASYLSLSPSLSCLVLQATKWKMAAVIARFAFVFRTFTFNFCVRIEK